MLSWNIEEHSHVFLVLPFGAAIIYVNREKLAHVRPGPSWVGPIIVAAGLALAWAGFNHAFESFWHMGAVLVALGAVITVLGHDVILKFWPAFLLLGFMVPMPNTLRLKLAFPLQTVMATLTQNILSFFGEPVGRQGNSLTINGEHVLIVEACNGLRMVFTLILVSWLFAFITPLKQSIKWLIILLSPVTALICNVVRLVPTLVLYGHASKTTADAFHDYAAWPMVFLAFVLLMLVVNLIEAMGFEIRGDAANPADAVGPPVEAMAGDPVIPGNIASDAKAN